MREELEKKKLQKMYQSSKPDSEKLRLKVKLIADMQKDYLTFKQQWQGYDGYDNFVLSNMNNAKILTVSTYQDWVPALIVLLQELNGDLPAFYQRCRELAKMTKAEREAELTRYRP